MRASDAHRTPSVSFSRAWAVCLLAAMAGGCLWHGTDGVPWWSSKKDKEEQLAYMKKYGPFAFERIDTIEKMGQYAAKSGQAEKEQVAAKLASDIQTEQDPLVRIVLIRELGRIPSEISTSVLTAGIKDPDPEVRQQVCIAWGKRVQASLKGGGMPPGPTEDAAVRTLSGALASDTNFQVQLAAARSLGNVPHDPRAIAALGIALKNSTTPAMTALAVNSLRSSSGKDFGGDVKQWQQYADTFIPQAPQQPGMPGSPAAAPTSPIATRPWRAN